MHEKLKAIVSELERHITEDGCACCRSKEYLQQLKAVLKEDECPVSGNCPSTTPS